MTFSIRDLKFIDSCQFVALYLGKLVEDLYEDNDEFKNIEMRQIYSEHMHLLCQKGVLPECVG